MINLDRRMGPWSLRVWGLITNFLGNALALHGAAGVVRGSGGRTALTVGLLVTISCILVLAVPTPDRDETA